MISKCFKNSKKVFFKLFFNFISLVQPIAQISCSIENTVFFCECKSDVGNPPSLVYWTKNGENIGDFGHGTKVLTTDDITKGGSAMYSCNVKSHNLADQKNITLGKRI